MIVFCGYANSDLTVHLPTLPSKGQRVQASIMARHDGGMGANAAVSAARIGAPTGFAGVVGTDALSTAFLEELNWHGVDTSWAARDGELTTAVILVCPDGERSIISQDDTITAAHIAGVVEQLSRRGGGLLYLDGYRFPWAAPLLRDAPNVDLAVDLDGCGHTDAALAALTAAEHVITGQEQARLIEAAPSAAAVEYRTNLLITDGARGWKLHTPHGRTHTGAALAIPARDTTGAGDCFTGAYLAEIQRGAAPPDAASFAAVAAGLSCTAPGARAGIPNRAQVTEHLATTLNVSKRQSTSS